MYTQTHSDIPRDTYTHEHMNIHTHKNTHGNTHTNTCTHIYTNIQIHRHTQTHQKHTHQPMQYGSQQTFSLIKGGEEKTPGLPIAQPDDSRSLMLASPGRQSENATIATPREDPHVMGPNRSTTGEKTITAPCSSPSCKHLEDIPEIMSAENGREVLVRRPG